MKVSNDKKLYNPYFSAKLSISGKHELLTTKQVAELTKMVKQWGRVDDTVDINIGSDIIDMAEVNGNDIPQRFLSGYKMYVRTTIPGVKNKDISVADAQQHFWENFAALSPFSVIKSWIQSAEENNIFDIKKINVKPKLYRSSNDSWYNGAKFIVPDKKKNQKGFKIDIYMFQDLLFSKIRGEQNYKSIIKNAKLDSKKEISHDDIISLLVHKDGYSEQELRNLINDVNNYNAVSVNRQTQKLYSDCKGNYNQERIVIHNRILDDIFINADIAKPKQGNKPTFIMLGGRGGSGKTKFGKAGDAKVYSKKNFILLNSDIIKRKLPEYRGINACEIHEESIDILNKAVNISVQKGLNVVLDGSMSDFGYCENLLRQFSKSGYNIEMYFMYLPREKAAERAMVRFKFNNRYVPLNILLNMKENEINFDILKRYASKYGFYSNDVGLDESPVLVDFQVPDLFNYLYKKCKYGK